MTKTITNVFLEASFHYYATPLRQATFTTLHLQNTREVGGTCGRNSMNALCKNGINGIREEIMTKVRAKVKVRLPLYMPRNRMLVQR